MFDFKKNFQDIIEIQANAIEPGKNVLILDDLLASGGTINGACNLFLKQAQAQVVQIFVLIELNGLKGRETIPNNIPIYSLLNYKI